MDNIALFIVLALLAEVLGTVGGFGSSLFFVPIASYFLDFHSVLGITALFHVSSNLSKIALFRSGFNKKLVLQMGIPALLFVLAGAYFSKFIQSNMLELGLSVFLIGISVFFLSARHLVVNPTAMNTISGGAISGVVAGLIGTGGALRGLTLSAFNLNKEVFIATSAIIDLLIDSGRSVVYFTNGYVHEHDLYLVAILLVVSFAGTYTGKLILNRVSEERFRKMVLFLVLITGLTTLWRFLPF